MKLTKSILREMIKDVLSEADIMDKEVKNPKTGNKIKVKTQKDKLKKLRG